MAVPGHAITGVGEHPAPLLSWAAVLTAACGPLRLGDLQRKDSMQREPSVAQHLQI